MELSGLTDPEVKEAAEELVVMDRDGDSSSLRDGYRRYHTLAPFELRVVRDRLQELAERADPPSEAEKSPKEWVHRTAAHHTLKHYAAACDHLLDWAEYDWNWRYILEGADEIRGHAERKESVLNTMPEDAPCTAVFRRAMWYTTYDPERHQEAIHKFKRDRMGAKDWKARIKTIDKARDDPEEVEYRAARRIYRDAGWSGAREGGRAELEALTDAILWTRRE